TVSSILRAFELNALAFGIILSQTIIRLITRVCLNIDPKLTTGLVEHYGMISHRRLLSFCLAINSGKKSFFGGGSVNGCFLGLKWAQPSGLRLDLAHCKPPGLGL